MLAGITVGVILIPQAIAYAFLTGVPPIYGLYASLIPLVIYAFLGTSQHLSIGPVAITSLLLMTGISQFATPFTPYFIELVLLTGLLVGVVQIILGFLRMGFLVHVLAQPVISGFISAAAFIIIISQFKSGFGIAIPEGSNSLESVAYVVSNIKTAHTPTFLVTLISVVLLLVFKKINKNFPGALVVIIGFTLGSFFFDFESKGIRIIGAIPEGLPTFYVPKISWELIKQLFPTVITVTLIGYIGSVGIAKSFQMKHRNYEVDPNKELIALGFSKLVGTFFQGILASGSYSRSAINEEAGAKTSISALFSAFIILISLLFLTPLFFYLPNPVLAAIILVSVFSLIKIKEAKRYLKVHVDDFVVMLVTFVITLLINIETGILVGVILSFVFLQYRSSKPHIAELVKIPGTDYYRNFDRFPNGLQHENYLILRFDDQLFFGNADYFKESIYDLLDQRSKMPNQIIIEATNIHNIDSTGLHTLEDLYRELAEKNIELLFSGMIGPVRDVLTRTGFMSATVREHQFMSIPDAITHINTNQPLSAPKTAFALQYNERKLGFLNWFKKKK